MQLYVGNIPFEATEQGIKEHFGKYGVSEVKIIKDKATGRSKGYCFIEIPEEQAQKAIDELHKTMYMGKRITVKHARFNNKQKESPNSWKYKYINQRR